MVTISDNKLEDSFVHMWRPLYLLQIAIGSARVNLVDNNVTNRLWYQKIFGCFNLVLCCSSIFYLTSRSAFMEIDNEWNLQSILSYAQVTTTLCLNSCPIIVNNFFHINANYNLFISLQNIDRALKINTNENHYKNLYQINLVVAGCLLLFHVAVDVFIVIQNIGYSELYLAVPAIFTLLAQDLELSFIFITLIYLILRVKYVNAMLNRIVDGRWKSLRVLESPTVMCNIFEAYRHIIKVYVLIQKTSELFLFLLCLHMFSNELLILEEFISQKKAKNALVLFQSVVVIVKVYNRILFAGIWTTRLQNHILQTRLACLRLINETTNKGFRRHAKNLYRLVKQVQPISVFGMFRVNTLPIKLAALTTTYAVVLLQFQLQTPPNLQDQ